MSQINSRNCTLVFDGIGRRSYVNSRDGRESLRADCIANNAESVYDEVIAVWGDSPTVADDIPPAPTFDELKSAKLAEMSADFEARVSGAVTTSQGYLMQFSPEDSIKMQGAITLLEATGQETGYITQADDVTIPDVQLDVMKTVMLEMIGAYAACHARKQELRALINAAQTKEELDEVVISWPV